MKKIFIGLTLMFAGVMASCGGHKTEVPAEDTVTVEEVVADSTVCDDAEAVPVDSLATSEEACAE